MKNFFGNIGRTLKVILNFFSPIRIVICLIVLIFIVLIAASSYVVYRGEIKDSNNGRNVPHAAGSYTSSVEIDTETGEMKTDMNAQELWDKLVENNSNVVNYLNGPEDLAKLLNVSIVTQYPDTRENPEEEIDWDKVLATEDAELQGIIKVKRNLLEGKTVLTEEELASLEKEYETYQDEFKLQQKEKAEKWKEIELNPEIVDMIQDSDKTPTEKEIDQFLEEKSGSEEETETWGVILKKPEVLDIIRNDLGDFYTQKKLVNAIERYVSEEDFPSTEKMLEYEEWLKNRGYTKSLTGEWSRPGEAKTMTYVDPETFESYISEYVNTGSEEAKQKALSHFTLEKKTSYSNKNAARIDSLDGLLFIGDSHTVRLEQRKSLGMELSSEYESLLKGALYNAEGSQGPTYWNEHFDELPADSEVNAVTVLLGVNERNTTAMKELINKLAEKYKGKNIYVQSVFHVGHSYTYMDGTTLNNEIDSYNKEIEDYCRYKDNVYYIDITRGLEGDDGYLKSELTADGLHLSSLDIWVENIVNNILETEDEDESSTNSGEEENEKDENKKEDEEESDSKDEDKDEDDESEKSATSEAALMEEPDLNSERISCTNKSL